MEYPRYVGVSLGHSGCGVTCFIPGRFAETVDIHVTGVYLGSTGAPSGALLTLCENLQ